VPFFKKEKFNATRIRQRMKRKMRWEDRVPGKVKEALKRMRGEERVRRL
jgi:nicotinamide mononucleotide adenylyltransferase